MAIVCLGSNGPRDKTTLSAGSKTVVEAMVEHKADRRVVLSAAGVGDSWTQIGKINRADVAACLVDQIDDPANSRQAIAVTA